MSPVTKITNKALRVSIVIPVYNEAAHLPACLDAIAAQTVQPYEVIVVDNNSTDGTAAIARAYPGVQVISEKRQGVVHARDHGFNAARGAIIGRIDADTIVSTDWVASLQRIFADESVGAVTGSAGYHDLPFPKLSSRIDLSLRRYLARVLGSDVAMQGANMAIRRTVWSNISPHLCRKPGMHEDFDVSIHATAMGNKVVFDESLLVTLGYRQAEACFRDFTEYVMLSPRTYALHGLRRQRYMYPVVWLAIAAYAPLKLLHRGYDKRTERFSWSRVMQVPAPAQVRVNPATYVD